MVESQLKGLGITFPFDPEGLTPFRRETTSGQLFLNEERSRAGVDLESDRHPLAPPTQGLNLDAGPSRLRAGGGGGGGLFLVEPEQIIKERQGKGARSIHSHGTRALRIDSGERISLGSKTGPSRMGMMVSRSEEREDRSDPSLIDGDLAHGSWKKKANHNLERYESKLFVKSHEASWAGNPAEPDRQVDVRRSSNEILGALSSVQVVPSPGTKSFADDGRAMGTKIELRLFPRVVFLLSFPIWTAFFFVFQAPFLWHAYSPAVPILSACLTLFTIVALVASQICNPERILSGHRPKATTQECTSSTLPLAQARRKESLPQSSHLDRGPTALSATGMDSDVTARLGPGLSNRNRKPFLLFLVSCSIKIIYDIVFSALEIKDFVESVDGGRSFRGIHLDHDDLFQDPMDPKRSRRDLRGVLRDIPFSLVIISLGFFILPLIWFEIFSIIRISYRGETCY
ncbi:hypothetical protein IE53DRAFT_68763 [Violaceomyces palustris]|uniref:Uncharacterized protein n=1 Tax=Violaceomyces palustris TaxID=1673888 RepID=A0ACD0NZ15_9BASI|nr:hypothetical protein IE53DRAFT_68763 [Violaceomyces palustris]